MDGGKLILEAVEEAEELVLILDLNWLVAGDWEVF